MENKNIILLLEIVKDELRERNLHILADEIEIKIIKEFKNYIGK